MPFPTPSFATVTASAHFSARTGGVKWWVGGDISSSKQWSQQGWARLQSTFDLLFCQAVHAWKWDCSMSEKAVLRALILFNSQLLPRLIKHTWVPLEEDLLPVSTHNSQRTIKDGLVKMTFHMPWLDIMLGIWGDLIGGPETMKLPLFLRLAKAWTSLTFIIGVGWAVTSGKTTRRTSGWQLLKALCWTGWHDPTGIFLINLGFWCWYFDIHYMLWSNWPS